MGGAVSGVGDGVPTLSQEGGEGQQACLLSLQVLPGDGPGGRVPGLPATS